MNLFKIIPRNTSQQCRNGAEGGGKAILPLTLGHNGDKGGGSNGGDRTENTSNGRHFSAVTLAGSTNYLIPIESILR